MKKYLLTLTLIASSIGVSNLANAQLQLCDCTQAPNQPCDQTQTRPGLYGNPLGPNQCIKDCHCAPNMHCPEGKEGPYTSTIATCQPR
jgi:hypothetical protein